MKGSGRGEREVMVSESGVEVTRVIEAETVTREVKMLEMKE